MYFWNIEKLKEDIRGNKLTEKNRFAYLLIYLVFNAFVITVLPNIYNMNNIFFEDRNIWDLAYDLLNVFVILIGTIFVFKANNSIKGIDFLGRFFSIGFVVNIRFAVYLTFLLIILTPLAVLFLTFFDFIYKENNHIDIIILAMSTILQIAIYWRMYEHIKQINSQ